MNDDIILKQLWPFISVNACVYQQLKVYRPQNPSSVDMLSSGQ